MRANDIVLILGSGPNAVQARHWPSAWFDSIVAINNAWRIRDDWDHLIFPEDFPDDRRPPGLKPGQRLVEAPDFVPAQNAFGGFVYAGGTMAFTAGYWALFALRPKVLAFMGCDMVYPPSGATHFYGTGAADPLRDDVTLRDLKAKSARLGLLAAERGCLCVNLSQDESQLVFDRSRPDDLTALQCPAPLRAPLTALTAQERELGYFVASGRYWEETTRFDPAALARLDAGWRDAWGESAC